MARTSNTSLCQLSPFFLFTCAFFTSFLSIIIFATLTHFCVFSCFAFYYISSDRFVKFIENCLIACYSFVSVCLLVVVVVLVLFLLLLMMMMIVMMLHRTNNIRMIVPTEYFALIESYFHLNLHIDFMLGRWLQLIYWCVSSCLINLLIFQQRKKKTIERLIFVPVFQVSLFFGFYFLIFTHNNIK